MLEIKHLQKSFGKHDVLKDISISVPQGKIVGLLGKNGAGKTTMIKCVLGLLNYSGEIIYDGTPLDHTDVQVMNSIGALVDTAFFDDMTAFDNMRIQLMSTPNRDNRRMKDDILTLLRFVGLDGNARDKVKGFSFGMKQRLALAQTLISNAKLLILDEPFVGLDPLGIILVKEKLIEMCRQNQTTVIFSSHQLSEVKEISDILIVIENGGIRYSGTYDELAQQNKQYRIILDKAINKPDMQRLATQGVQIQAADQDGQYVLLQGGSTLDVLLRQLYQSDYTVREIIREDKILESLFV